MSARTRTEIVFAASLGLLLAAGSVWAESPSSVVQVANYKGGDRQARLEQGARKEAVLQIYTSMDLEESEPVMKGFMKKYPFVRGEIYRASGEEVAQRIITEYRGRKYSADIVEGTGIDVAKMLNEGYGQSFYSP